MTDTDNRRTSWEGAVLAELRRGASVSSAARAAGISPATAYSLRRKNGRFAGEWERATRGQQRRGDRFTRKSQWKRAFLEALAESSNVSAAAARVNIPTPTVYRMRREDPEFAAKWLGALREGYDHLEMEVLGYLRNPNPAHKMDVPAALRLLAAHRATVERHRALADEEDEQAVLESLDAFFEGLRQRRLANEALLAGTADNADED